MNRTDTFIQMLEEFREFSKDNTKEHERILFSLGYVLGDQGKLFEYDTVSLKDKIDDLTQNYGLDEKFLVDSLVYEIDRLLQSSLEEHGKSILNNERQLKNFQDHGEDTALFENTLARLKDPNYVPMLKSEIHFWEVLKMNNYNDSHDKEWEYEKDQEAMESQRKLMESLPPEYQDMTLKELKDKGIL